jgi:hypothetical protein
MITRYYLYRKFLHDYVQVIQHNRNWGLPQRRGPTGSKNQEEEKISPEIFDADVEEPAALLLSRV